MKNYTNSVVFALMLVAVIIAIPNMVKAQANGGDDVAVASQSSTTNGGDDTSASNTTNGGDDVVASNTTNGGDDVAPSNTSNGGDDVTNGSSTTNGGDDVTNGSSTTNGGDDTAPSSSNTTNGGDDTKAETPSTPEPEKNPDSSSGSRGGRSRNRTTPVVATTLPILTAINTSDCPYLNSYMRFGVENDKTDVTKLQIFLKNSEGLNVDINGIFDQKTLDAVNAFQAKYVEETMAPWGATIPSGQVFYTTKNKINELVCKTPIKLTAEQLAFIEAYKTGQTDGVIGTTNPDGTVGTSTEIGSADAPLKAAVGTSSIFGKVWGFIKWLFGY